MHCWKCFYNNRCKSYLIALPYSSFGSLNIVTIFISKYPVICISNCYICARNRPFRFSIQHFSGNLDVFLLTSNMEIIHFILKLKAEESSAFINWFMFLLKMRKVFLSKALKRKKIS